MKIGLLECDHVADKFRPIGGDYREMFPALLPQLDMAFYDVCKGHFPDDVRECDAYICTGSKYSVYDEMDWIRQLKGFVREVHDQEKPFIGVCFGHQMMGEALGGKVQKAEAGWCLGVHSFQLQERPAWIKPPRKSFNLLMLCQDQIKALPPDSRVLASAADCPVGMFMVGKHMLGIQAHPEFLKPYVKAIIKDRKERVGAPKATAGLKSLRRVVHSPVVAQWMQAFLTERLMQKG